MPYENSNIEAPDNYCLPLPRTDRNAAVRLLFALASRSRSIFRQPDSRCTSPVPHALLDRYRNSLLAILSLAA
jgi:hypothetical protein